jgi:hypothetical protein
MSKQAMTLRVNGLFLNPSQFSQIPPGALSQADNVVIDRENIVSTRRGMFRYGTGFDSTGVEGLFNYANTLLAYTQDDRLWRDSDGLGTWVAYSGTYAVPDAGTAGSRIRSIESNKNFYFLTNSGTMKLDAVSSTPRLAGAPKALGGTGASTGATGFQPTATNVAYRVVWGYKDANSNLILGAPSERIVVPNATGHGANVSLTFQIPDEINATWFYQVYRSLPSSGATVQPNDELQQTIEGVPSGAELTAGFITVTDTTPDSLLQAYLYTNPSQGGILQANYRPPFARDGCTYKGYNFYANTRTVHRLNVNLLSSEPPLGLQVDDVITFTRYTGGTFTVIGKAVENATAGQFQVFNTGDPGLDIQNTAQSLVRVVNIYGSNTFLNAYYMSDFESTPGQLMFEMTTLTETGFYMNSSRVTAWSPEVLATGTGSSSENEVAPNRIYYSRSMQPEAVPLLNWLEVGSKNQPIDRILPLRDGIIVLKQDGVFRVSGSVEPFAQQGLDNSVRIIAANSAAVLDNSVYFLSDQGVVAATDNAVQIFSRPIEREILRLTSPAQFPNTADLAFATCYNGDRKYILSMPLTGTDAFCRQQFCYNTITNTWTRWTRETLCGIVNIRDNKLYFGGPTKTGFGGYVFKERKTYTNLDFADEEYSISITGSSGLTVTVASTANLKVDMTITQESSSSSAIIMAINGLNLTMSDVGAWTNGAATAFTPIESIIKTVQLDSENPGIMKQFSEMSFIYTEANFRKMEAYFTSDLNGAESKQILKPTQRGSWGQFSWGTVPWGGAVTSQQARIRTMIPFNQQRANWIFARLRLNQCFTSFGLSGYSFSTNDMSSRQRQSGD